MHQMSDLLPESSDQPEVFAYYDFDDTIDAADMLRKLKELEQ